ncbi:GNAT family N-acetyltransferase [Acinetobacter sp. ME22]|uniref:GNAT family N-acetyltransferase n=1 Tax=Acinetobacter sp. ME22 TaxID=2904802 RepID=UPI001EDBE7E2|nr:GNAT family N-acetyltransferase [Acinetobacter sp. ME22]MCG2572190.1 GNAT family N-acetyltransferase [Acinetobacter sp. ME22]
MNSFSDQFLDVPVNAQQVQPFIDGLFNEYFAIYGDFFAERGHADEYAEKSKSDKEEPAEWYAPPNGLFITLQRNNEIIAMGAYKRYDEQTAELKRIWTRSDLRKQGLAAKIVKELERRAKQAGYSHVYLTTGFKQIPAVKLYLSLGYEPQFELNPEFNFEHYAESALKGTLPFRKAL